MVVLGVLLVVALGVGEGLSGLGILNLPVLLLVLLLGLLKTDLVLLLTLNLVHGEGLTGGGADDLEGVLLSLDWGELPLLLLAVGVAVHLGDDFAVSVVGDDLDLVSFLLVKGKTVVVIVSALLGNKNLVPGLLWVLVVSDDLGLILPAVGLLASSAVIKDLLVVGVLDLDPGAVSKDGWSAGGLLWVGDAPLVHVVPVLVLWALLLAPLAVVGVALQVLLAVVGGRGLVVDVLLVALGVGGWVVILTVLLTLLGLALLAAGRSSQESSIAAFFR